MNNKNMDNTNYRRSKKSGVFKIISIVLITTFFVQNIVWANPDTGGGNAAFNTLQVQSAFAPLVNPRLQHEALIKLPLDYVLKKIGKYKIDKFDIKLTPKLFLNNSKNVIQTSGKVTLPQYRDENGEYVNVVLDFEGKWKSDDHVFLPCAIKYKGDSLWEYVAEIDPMTGGFVLMKKGEITPDAQPFAELVTAPIWHKSWHALWQKRASLIRKVEFELSDMLEMEQLSYRLDDICRRIDQEEIATAIGMSKSELEALGTRKRKRDKKKGIELLKNGLNLLKEGSLSGAKDRIKNAKKYFIRRRREAERIALRLQLREFPKLLDTIDERNKGIIKDFIEPIKNAAKTDDFRECYRLLRISISDFIEEPEFRMLKPLVLECVYAIGGTETSEAKRRNIEDAMNKLGWLVKASNESNSFMRSFRLALVKRVIRERTDYRQLQEDVFGAAFQSFMKRSDLTRGSPGRLWTILYQAAFISLEIDNPQKTSERIPNPLFNTVDSLISIKLVKDFTTLTQSRGFLRQNPKTAALLEQFVNKRKNNFTDLTEDMRSLLFMKLAGDHDLDIVDSVRLWASQNLGVFTVVNDMAHGDMPETINMSVSEALYWAETKQLFLAEDGQFYCFGGGLGIIQNRLGSPDFDRVGQLEGKRERALSLCGVYSNGQLVYIHKLYQKYLGSGLKNLTQYEQIELWSYMVLMKIEKERYKLLEDAVMAARKGMGDDILSEIDDLYIGYNWPTKLSTVELDKKIDFLTKETGISRLKPNSRIYSIGCDNGETLISLAERYPNLRFTGLDANPHNLGRAIDELQKRKKEGKSVDNIQFCLADCRPRIEGVSRRGIPAKDNSVDMVMILEGAMEDSEYQPEWMTQLWAEALRVAKKPGAKIVFTASKGVEEVDQQIKACGMEKDILFYESKFAVSPWLSDDASYQRDYVTASVYELKKITERIVPPSRESSQPEGPEQGLFSFSSTMPQEPESSEGTGLVEVASEVLPNISEKGPEQLLFSFEDRSTLRGITEGLDAAQKDFLSNYLRGTIDIEEAIEICFDKKLINEAVELAVSVIKKRPEMVSGEKVTGWITRCVKADRMDWAGRIKAAAIDNGIKGITSNVEEIRDERVKEETLDPSSDTAIFAVNSEVKGITLDTVEEQIKRYFRKGGYPRGVETMMDVIENESNGISLEMTNKWIGRGVEIMIAAIENKISGITLETISKWVEMCFKQKRPVLAGKVALLAIESRIEGITVDIVDKWIGGDFRKKYPDWHGKIVISAIDNGISGITADVVKRWMGGLREESPPDRAGNITMMARPDLAGKIAMAAMNKNIEGITLNIPKSAMAKCLAEGYPVAAGEIAMSFVDYLVADPDMKQIPLPELSALLASASNFLSRSGIRRANENTLRKSMETNDEEFMRIKGLLDALQKTFRDVNNKLAPKRRYSEEAFREDYTHIIYTLEIILPGSIKYMIGLLNKSKNPQAVLRFLDQKKEALMEDDITEALMAFVDKVRVILGTRRNRKKVKLDTVDFYRVINIANGFEQLGNIESLTKVLSEHDASMSMDTLSNALIMLQLRGIAESLGIDGGDVKKEVHSKLYMPFIDRLSQARRRIKRDKPHKLPVFEALLKATLKNRFWDFIENEKQDDEIGRAIAVHNKGVREALRAKGIDVEAWLGRKEKKRYMKHEFTHYERGTGKSMKRFTIEPIPRSPGKDLFIGDLTNSCFAMNSTLQPEAMVDRLIDEGMNVINVVDEDTHKAVAAVWLFIAEDGSLCVSDMEIHASYDKIKLKSLKDRIGEEMMEYVIRYAVYIGAEKLFICATRYGKFEEFVDKRYSGKKVPFKLEKIGGYFGEKYYFDTNGKDEAYLVADNLDVQKEVKADLADDPVVLQEGKDTNKKNIPKEMANKFTSALISTALSKKKVVLLFSSNLKTKEAIKNVDACIDILKEDNLVGEFLEGVEREELTPEDLQKRALEFKDREDVLVFTYAPESDKDELGEMNDWAAKTRNTNINPAYINEEGLNEKETMEGEFYYPIFEMVTLSLIDYLTRDTAGGVFGVLKAMNIDPSKFNLKINHAGKVGDRSNIMFFVILPDAEKYDTERRRNRYEELRHILRYL
jgi:hypothetical protein